MFYNFNLNSHYFVPMRPLRGIPGLFSYTSSLDRLIYVECKIVEEEYKLKDEYKIELRALDPNYGKEIFYTCDFNSMLKTGYIVEKTSPKQHSEDKALYVEHLYGDAFLITIGSVVCE